MSASEQAFCAGPLLWCDVPDHDAILECAACDYLIVAGDLHDEAHSPTEMLRAS